MRGSQDCSSGKAGNMQSLWDNFQSRLLDSHFTSLWYITHSDACKCSQVKGAVLLAVNSWFAFKHRSADYILWCAAGSVHLFPPACINRTTNFWSWYKYHYHNILQITTRHWHSFLKNMPSVLRLFDLMSKLSCVHRDEKKTPLQSVHAHKCTVTLYQYIM